MYHRDSLSEVVPFAHIEIRRESQTIASTSADLDGKWSLSWEFEPGDELQVSFLGYQTKVLPISGEELDELMKIILLVPETYQLVQPFEYGIMGEVSIAEPYQSKKSLWQKFTSLFY